MDKGKRVLSTEDLMSIPGLKENNDFVIRSRSPSAWLAPNHRNGKGLEDCGAGSSMVGSESMVAHNEGSKREKASGGTRVPPDQTFALVAHQPGALPREELGKKRNVGGSPSLGSPTRENMFKAGSSAKAELVGYIEKGKKLTNKYLSNAFSHLLELLVKDLEE